MENLATVKAEMMKTSRNAAETFFNGVLGGKDRFMCGFAWITITPKHKGNTKLGKAERVEYKELGFELDWTGKTFQLWNPSKMNCQNVDTLLVGAQAGAKYLKELGYNASASSRLD